ncbi:MAG: hypothetical protein IJT26_07135 [Bacteroidales bacterium]|nr:hypothetical protein [Bacteroidales bacterium]
MKSTNYNAPLCEWFPVEAGSLICASGSATGEGFGNGTDFGGKDRWEGTKW